MRSDNRRSVLSLPSLSDEAAVELHDFLLDFFRLFESHYGDQIHRYYENRSYHSLAPDPPLQTDEPPF